MVSGVRLFVREIQRGLHRACTDKRWLGLLFLFVAVDQLTKLATVELLRLDESRTVIPGFFNYVYVRNYGAAFGIFAGLPDPWREIVLFGATFLALSVVFSFLGSPAGDTRWGRISLALICGGAFGNLVDRAIFGYVVDFLDFYIGSYRWPAFNFADSFICVGVGMLLLAPMPDRVAASTEAANPHSSAERPGS